MKPKGKILSLHEIDEIYEGRWVLVYQRKKSLTFVEGAVVEARDRDGVETFRELTVLLFKKYGGRGFVHYAHADLGEDLTVTYL
jgi:hypothetical protein